MKAVRPLALLFIFVVAVWSSAPAGTKTLDARRHPCGGLLNVYAKAKDPSDKRPWWKFWGRQELEVLHSHYRGVALEIIGDFQTRLGSNAASLVTLSNGYTTKVQPNHSWMRHADTLTMDLQSGAQGRHRRELILVANTKPEAKRRLRWLESAANASIDRLVRLRGNTYWPIATTATASALSATMIGSLFYTRHLVMEGNMHEVINRWALAGSMVVGGVAFWRSPWTLYDSYLWAWSRAQDVGALRRGQQIEFFSFIRDAMKYVEQLPSADRDLHWFNLADGTRILDIAVGRDTDGQPRLVAYFRERELEPHVEQLEPIVIE